MVAGQATQNKEGDTHRQANAENKLPPQHNIPVLNHTILTKENELNRNRKQ